MHIRTCSYSGERPGEGIGAARAAGEVIVDTHRRPVCGGVCDGRHRRQDLAEPLPARHFWHELGHEKNRHEPVSILVALRRPLHTALSSWWRSRTAAPAMLLRRVRSTRCSSRHSIALCAADLARGRSSSLPPRVDAPALRGACSHRERKELSRVLMRRGRLAGARAEYSEGNFSDPRRPDGCRHGCRHGCLPAGALSSHSFLRAWMSCAQRTRAAHRFCAGGLRAATLFLRSHLVWNSC